MDTTHHSCQWILTLISSRPAHHTLVPGSACSPGTQSHVQHIFSHADPFLHSSELFSGDLAYFKPPAHKVTVSASRLHHIVFSPAFINRICVTLPTHVCTENAEIFRVSLSIWFMEGCYVSMSTFLRKRGNFLIFMVIKFEILMWMFLFSRTRCLRLLKRERKFSWV